MTDTPKPGEIWIEDDPRLPIERRRVEVLAIASTGDQVRIRRGNRVTLAQLKRFGKSGGYVRPGEERPSKPRRPWQPKGNQP